MMSKFFVPVFGAIFLVLGGCSMFTPKPATPPGVGGIVKTMSNVVVSSDAKSAMYKGTVPAIAYSGIDSFAGDIHAVKCDQYDQQGRCVHYVNPVIAESRFTGGKNATSPKATFSLPDGTAFSFGAGNVAIDASTTQAAIGAARLNQDAKTAQVQNALATINNQLKQQTIQQKQALDVVTQRLNGLASTVNNLVNKGAAAAIAITHPGLSLGGAAPSAPAPAAPAAGGK